MTSKTIKARDLAFKKHKNQRYGVYPYEIHLTNVVSVLLHFGFTFKDEEIIIAAWLHDIIEDTDIDKTYITTHFGENISAIVKAVSNHKNDKKTKQENKRTTFSEISKIEKAIIVKLADRITNVEFSVLHGNNDMIIKYKKEQLIIDELIAPKLNSEKAKKMYSYLKEIIT